jgi:oligopeptide/dipeptide ABC transporter ATP-binding protein
MSLSDVKPVYDRNLVDVVGMKKYFPIRAGLIKKQVGAVRAVDEVTFYIKRGETLGLVGESGCGKTTVGRAIMMLTPPTSGYVFFETPKVVVADFRELLNARHKFEKNPSDPVLAVRLLGLIDKLISAPACELKKDKKSELCADAANLRRHIEKRSGDGKVSDKKDNILNLADEAIEDVAQRYCINYRRKGEVKRLRGRIQFVFQDPFSSLDPKMLIKNIVAEPLLAKKKYAKKSEKRTGTDSKTWTKEGIDRQVIQLLEKVGLNVEHMYRYPHEFSGGQRQRIGIARALSVRPDFVVLDEPTSALDVSVQAQILNMLNALQNDFGLTYLFISHDLSTIKYMCDRVAVMYLGKIAEYAPKKDLYSKPVHPYTEALLSVIPVPDPDLKRDRIILPGDVPSPANPPPGCRFHTRCPLAIDICKKVEPPLIDIGNEHYVACHVRAPAPEIFK